MPKPLKYFAVVILTACLALGGGIVASGGIYDAYKMAFGEARWQTKYNNFVDAASSLGSLVANWVGTVDTLTLIQTAPAYSDASTFTLAGNYSAVLTAGKRLVADCGADGLQPNTVVSCTYVAPNSTVVVTTANLTANLAAVSYYATRNGLNTYGSGDIVAGEFGAPSWANLQSAVALANSTGRRLLVTPGNWPVSDHLIATSPWHVAPGALLEIATAKTLTLNGALDAGLDQIFSCAGTGKVVLAAGAVQEIRPEWWATNITPGTTDMTAAILAAYTAVQDAKRGKVRLLPTTYAIADLIFPTNAPNWPAGILIEGSGQGTKIVPAAAHTVGNFLMTFQGVGEVGGVGQTGTGWITLADFYIDGGGNDLKGILIQPSNNFRLRDITFFDIRGTALEAERPYDLYATRLRFYGCGSFADSEAAVRMISNPIGTTTSLSWGNQVYWTDCNIEAYQYRGLELIGCSLFNGRGGKVHGSIKTVTTSLGNVYVDGGGEIRLTDMQLSHPHRAPALYIKDNPAISAGYYSQVSLSHVTFSQCDSYDSGVYDLKVVHHEAIHPSSQLTVNNCTFNIASGGSLGTNGKFIHIGTAVHLWRVNIGQNIYETSNAGVILQDDRNVFLVPDAPTYVDADTLTVPGNYTSSSGNNYRISIAAGQGIWAVVAAGTVYSTIASRTYDAGTNKTTINFVDAVLTDPVTSVTFVDGIRHVGAVMSEVHAINLTLGLDALGGTVVTIADDMITLTQATTSYIRLGTEGGAASDNLMRINGGRIGSVLVVRVSLQSQPVTVKHGTGNIWLTGKVDFTLNSNKDILVLFNTDGSTWVQIGGGDNG